MDHWGQKAENAIRMEKVPKVAMLCAAIGVTKPVGNEGSNDVNANFIGVALYNAKNVIVK